MERFYQQRGDINKMNKEVNCLEYRVPFSQTEYVQTLIHNHFQESDLTECLEIEKKLALPFVKVKAWYRPEGEDRVLVVLTLGKVFDDLIEEYEKNEELLSAYAVECFAMAILKKAYDIFRDEFYGREGKYPGEYHFLDEKELRSVQEILRQMKIREVSCNEAFALVPQKTVVFLTEVSDKRNVGCISVCGNCSREDCPNRTSEPEEILSVLNYGYQRILGNGDNALWKKD